MYYSAPAVMPNYYNYYYYNPWQPVFCNGRSVIPLKQTSPRIATSAQQRRVSNKLNRIKNC